MLFQEGAPAFQAPGTNFSGNQSLAEANGSLLAIAAVRGAYGSALLVCEQRQVVCGGKSAARKLQGRTQVDQGNALAQQALQRGAF